MGEGDQVASIAAFTMVDEPAGRATTPTPTTNGHAPANGAAAGPDAMLNETIPLELDEGDEDE